MTQFPSDFSGVVLSVMIAPVSGHCLLYTFCFDTLRISRCRHISFLSNPRFVLY